MADQFTGVIQQRSPAVKSEGVAASPRLTSTAGLITADWKLDLLMQGRVFRTTVGTISAGADVSLVTGGGNGTTIDSDQPELLVGVKAGHYMIPLEFHCTGIADLDANAEKADILLFADLTQAPDGTGTFTTETPTACLDSGDYNSQALAYSAFTADTTDPVLSETLAYKAVTASEFVSNGTATNLTNGVTVAITLDYEPSVPLIMKGPCSVVACWGGTAAVTGMATLVWAELPNSYFE